MPALYAVQSARLPHYRISYFLRAAATGIFILAFGCAAPPSAPPSRSAAPANSPPIDVTLEKVTQPAFAADYADRTVRFDAKYLGSMAVFTDLAAEYQQGFVRIILLHGSFSTPNVLVPKEFADATFALKTGERVRVTAYAQPVNMFSGITGGQQNQLLLIVSSIVPIAETVRKPRSRH